jgi:hypothetical protein
MLKPEYDVTFPVAICRDKYISEAWLGDDRIVKERMSGHNRFHLKYFWIVLEFMVSQSCDDCLSICVIYLIRWTAARNAKLLWLMVCRKLLLVVPSPVRPWIHDSLCTLQPAATLCAVYVLCKEELAHLYKSRVAKGSVHRPKWRFNGRDEKLIQNTVRSIISAPPLQNAKSHTTAERNGTVVVASVLRWCDSRHFAAVARLWLNELYLWDFPENGY